MTTIKLDARKGWDFKAIGEDHGWAEAFRLRLAAFERERADSLFGATRIGKEIFNTRCDQAWWEQSGELPAYAYDTYEEYRQATDAIRWANYSVSDGLIRALQEMGR